jgi:hypothetical protein
MRCQGQCARTGNDAIRRDEPGGDSLVASASSRNAGAHFV